MTEAPPTTPQESTDESESMPVGPFLFTPALQLTWEGRDNIYFTPDSEVADDMYIARARLMFELPIYDNYVRFSYLPKYREFAKTEYEHHWSHDVGLTGAFDFPSGLKLIADYRYFLGNLEVREIDPGAELMYGLDEFTKNWFQLTADYWFNPRDGLRVEGAYSNVAYDRPVGSYTPVCPRGTVCEFYDYSELYGGVGWLHQMSETLVMDLSYHRREFTAEQTLDYRNQTSNELTVGFEGQISPVFSTALHAGWRQTKPDLQPGDPHVDDYSAPLIAGDLSYQLAHGSILRLDLVYTDYPSDFGANAFYTATGASLIYDLQRDRLFGQARLRFQNNDYDQPDPQSGSHRSDDIKSAGLGIGYRITELIWLSGGYIYEDRDTLYPYSYTVNTFVLSLGLGYGSGF